MSSIVIPATDIDLDLNDCSKSALEAMYKTPFGSEIKLVEREGRIYVFSEDDKDAGRPEISHIVTAADHEAVIQLLDHGE
jgi:hypothetical protein